MESSNADCLLVDRLSPLRLRQRRIHQRSDRARSSRHLVPVEPCRPPLSSHRENVRVFKDFKTFSSPVPLTCITAFQWFTPFTLRQSSRPSTPLQSSITLQSCTTLQSFTPFTPLQSSRPSACTQHRSSRPSTLHQSSTASTPLQSCSTITKRRCDRCRLHCQSRTSSNYLNEKASSCVFRLRDSSTSGKIHWRIFLKTHKTLVELFFLSR